MSVMFGGCCWFVLVNCARLKSQVLGFSSVIHVHLFYEFKMVVPMWCNKDVYVTHCVCQMEKP